jgi:hypothetical protein
MFLGPTTRVQHRHTSRPSVAPPTLKAVAVRFGRLGNHRPGSRLFEAPDLTRIAEIPLVSCLCVTENRHAFMPWLLWGYDRQAWKRRELVVVDSSDPPVSLPKRSDIRVLHVPPGTSLGKKRNLALEAARGQVVAWFDDDDWQHPKRLSTLVPLLREYAIRIGASFIGPSRSNFLHIYGHRSERFLMVRYAIFNGSVYYRDMVRHARFPEDVLRTEDTRWISALLRKRQGAAIVDEHPSLFLWLCHSVNVSNATHVRQLPLEANELIRSLGSAWADTPQRLAELRQRLAAYPARRPVRVELAEPAGVPSDRAPVPATRPDPPAPPRPVPRADPTPLRAVPSTRKLSLYLACTNHRAEKPGYVPLAVTSSRFGWLSAFPATYTLRRSDWEESDYVGILDGDAPWHPDAELVASAVERREARRGIWVLGELDPRPLKAHLAAYPNGEKLARYLLERLSIRDPGLLEREITSCESGWIATPSVFTEYVRNWLIPARTLFGKRSDPVLERVLRQSGASDRGEIVKVEPTIRRILELLPAIAFSRAGRGTQSLGLSKRAVASRADPRLAGPPATLVAPVPRAIER